MEIQLGVLENTVLRKTFDAQREAVDRGWRKPNSEELHDLWPSPNIIRVIRARRIGWAWNVACMEKEINIYKVLVGGSEVKRALGRPRHMWDNWRALCELVNIPSVSINFGEYYLY